VVTWPATHPNITNATALAMTGRRNEPSEWVTQSTRKDRQVSRILLPPRILEVPGEEVLEAVLNHHRLPSPLA
jgi:hypothetical protein